MLDEVKMLKELNEQKTSMIEVLLKLVDVQAETIKAMRTKAIDDAAVIMQLQSEAIERKSVDEALGSMKKCVAHVNALETQLCEREADIERREHELKRTKTKSIH